MLECQWTLPYLQSSSFPLVRNFAPYIISIIYSLESFAEACTKIAMVVAGFLWHLRSTIRVLSNTLNAIAPVHLISLSFLVLGFLFGESWHMNQLNNV